jgi:hypothetical protein
VILFHIHDPAERDLPGDAPVTYEDAESGERLPLRPEVLRPKYQAEVEAHRRELARLLGRDRVDYIPLVTTQPLDIALHAYLENRLATSRVR